MSGEVVELRTRKKGSGGKGGAKRANFHGQKFAGFTEEFLKCDALKVLTSNEHLMWLLINRVFSCELGGFLHQNGRIAITHERFEAEGVGRKCIASGTRALEALGLIKVERGLAGAEGYRKSSLYGITAFPMGIRGGKAVATNDWAKFTSVESARAAAIVARADIHSRNHKSWELYGPGQSEAAA